MSASKGEGRREDALVKQRNQMREDFERQKQSLINETEKARPSANRFVGQHDSMEDTLKHSTVGLVHLEDFQQKRKELEEAKAREAAKSNDLKYVPDVENPFRDDTKRLRKRKKIAKATLSFAMDEDGDDGSQLTEGDDMPTKEKEDTLENVPPAKRNKFRKNPDVDTSFLPDRDREEAERKERERLRLEWLAKQETIRNEDIEIVYSYWDGSGHRKTVTVRSVILRIILFR
ncbi:hypothetical protein C0993_011366 [Termitomyces sp. T159_Od127]|nr:hypothetical protein C0993_011366 [Termitomyces sp. T159_Od127]